MAFCATRTSFTGHPSIEAKADDALTSKLDQLVGSGQLFSSPHARAQSFSQEVELFMSLL
jgi:hypothetical protein